MIAEKKRRKRRETTVLAIDEANDQINMHGVAGYQVF